VSAGIAPPEIASSIFPQIFPKGLGSAACGAMLVGQKVCMLISNPLPGRSRDMQRCPRDQ